MDPRRSTAKRSGRLNLKAVSEVLLEHGYDPTEELIKLLVTPVGEDGLPIKDQHGKPLAPALAPAERAKLWNELLQYTQGKKKAVDIKVTGAVTAFSVTADQATRIAEEFLRSGAAQAVVDEAIADEIDDEDDGPGDPVE